MSIVDNNKQSENTIQSPNRHGIFVFSIRIHLYSISFFWVFMCIQYSWKIMNTSIHNIFNYFCERHVFINTFWIHCAYMSYFHRAWSTTISISQIVFLFFFPANCFYYFMGIQGWYELSYFLRAVGLSLRFYNNIPFQSIILKYWRIKICFLGYINVQYFQLII